MTASSQAFICDTVRTLFGRYGGTPSRVRADDLGGAIALGYLLGASEARLVTVAINRLHATGGRHVPCAMCIGVSQSIVVVLEHA